MRAMAMATIVFRYIGRDQCIDPIHCGGGGGLYPRSPHKHCKKTNSVYKKKNKMYKNNNRNSNSNKTSIHRTTTPPTTTPPPTTTRCTLQEENQCTITFILPTKQNYSCS